MSHSQFGGSGILLEVMAEELQVFWKQILLNRIMISRALNAQLYFRRLEDRLVIMQKNYWCQVCFIYKTKPSVGNISDEDISSRYTDDVISSDGLGGLNCLTNSSFLRLNSMRQRQLLCLGRLLLKDTNVLFMDEATTYVDSQADAVIQKAIKYFS
ncbi:ABC transporter C family member 4-like protein [Tanacetum coccineum]